MVDLDFSSPEPLPTRRRVLFSDDIEEPPIKSSPARDLKPTKSILRNSSEKCQPRILLPDSDVLDRIHQGMADLSEIPPLDVIVDAALRTLLTSEPGSHLKVYNALVLVFRNEERRIQNQALIDKLCQLLIFAKRDLQWSEASTNMLDSRIVLAILKVVDFLLFTDETAVSCDYDTARWFLMRGLEVLENENSSKAMVCSYTHIFYSQRLPRTLPNEMAYRLLSSLCTRTNFQSSNAAAEYLAAYRRLIQTHPSLMIAEAAKWVSPTIRSLVHVSSTVRHQALALVQECTKRLPSNKVIGRRVWVMFNEPEAADRQPLPLYDASQGTMKDAAAFTDDSVNDSSSDIFFNTFQERLLQLLSVPGEEKYAMAVWSSVLLLLMSWGEHADQSVEKWEHLGRMFEVWKSALNSKQLVSKTAAIQTWTTPIYIWTCRPFATYKPDVLKRHFMVLIHPFKLLTGCSAPLRKALSSAFFALILASMRVSTETQQLDILWDQAVLPILKLYQKSSVDSTREMATEIVQHLMQLPSSAPSPGGNGITNSNFSTTSKTMHRGTSNRSRILQPTLINLDEVPCFPSKWVRLRSGKIANFIVSLLEDCSATWEDVAPLWLEMLKGVKAAMQREIHTSSDTMEHVVAVCNFVKSVWQKNLVSEADLQLILVSAIDTVGAMPYLDQALVASNSSQDFSLSPNFKNKSRRSDEALPLSKSAVIMILEVLIDESCSRKASGQLLAGIVSLARQKLKPEKRQEFLPRCVVLFGNNQDIWSRLFSVTVTQDFSLPSSDWDDLGWQALNWVINKSGDPSKLSSFEIQKLSAILAAMNVCKSTIREFDIGFLKGFVKILFDRCPTVHQIIQCLELYKGVPRAFDVFAQQYQDLILDSDGVYDIARGICQKSMESLFLRDNNDLVREVAVCWLAKWDGNQYNGKMQYDFNRMYLECLKYVFEDAVTHDRLDDMHLVVRSFTFALLKGQEGLKSMTTKWWNTKLLNVIMQRKFFNQLLVDALDDISQSAGIFLPSDFPRRATSLDDTLASPAASPESPDVAVGLTQLKTAATTNGLELPTRRSLRRSPDRSNVLENNVVTSPATQLGIRRSKRLEHMSEGGFLNRKGPRTLASPEPSQNDQAKPDTAELKLIEDTQPVDNMVFGVMDEVCETQDAYHEPPLLSIVTPATESYQADPAVDATTSGKNEPEVVLGNALESPAAVPSLDSESSTPLTNARASKKRKGRKKRGRKALGTTAPAPISEKRAREESSPDVPGSPTGLDVIPTPEIAGASADMSPASDFALEERLKALEQFESKNPLVRELERRCLSRSYTSGAYLCESLSDDLISTLDADARKRIEEFRTRDAAKEVIPNAVDEPKRRKRGRPRKSDQLVVEDSPKPKKKKADEQLSSQMSYESTLDNEVPSLLDVSSPPTSPHTLESDAQVISLETNTGELVVDGPMAGMREVDDSGLKAQGIVYEFQQLPRSKDTISGLFGEEYQAGLRSPVALEKPSLMSDSASASRPAGSPLTPSSSPSPSDGGDEARSGLVERPSDAAARCIAEMNDLSSSPPGMDESNRKSGKLVLSSTAAAKEKPTARDLIGILANVNWDDADYMSDLSSQECFELEGLLMRAMMQARRVQVNSRR